MFSVKSCLPHVAGCHHLNWKYCDKNGHPCLFYHRKKEQKGVTRMDLLNVRVPRYQCVFVINTGVNSVAIKLMYM